MLNIRKAFVLLPVALLAIPTLTSCGGNDSGSKDGTIYLKVLNSEDYIYEYDEEEAKKEGGNPRPNLTTQFEEYMKSKGKNVKVIYDTFDTMENMYNTLKTGKTKYDVICASEYMIQKLVSEGNLVQTLDYDNKIPNYKKYASTFIRDKLKDIPAIAGGDKSIANLDSYAMCYMWGTLGIIYNPTFKTFVDRGISQDVEKEMNYWSSLWDSKYSQTISIKDSMRDTYAIGVMESFKNELKAVEGNETERNKIFNYGGASDSNAKEHVNAVKDNLLKLRSNSFGFEVDSGKQDIVTGKIGINTAWSGDAVYSMDQGDEEGAATLYYSIPESGTNLWFDCWCMQQGANVEIASEFLNFISAPENAIQNIDSIGYTSAIAGDDVFKHFEKMYEPTTSETTSYDVSYFFGDNHSFTIDAAQKNRQMAAQFPNKNVISNLMVMQDYGKNNDLILSMWEQVKHESLPTWAIALLSIEGSVVLAGIVVIVVLKVNDKKRRKNRRSRLATVNK